MYFGCLTPLEVETFCWLFRGGKSVNSQPFEVVVVFGVLDIGLLEGEVGRRQRRRGQRLTILGQTKIFLDVLTLLMRVS